MLRKLKSALPVAIMIILSACATKEAAQPQATPSPPPAPPAARSSPAVATAPTRPPAQPDAGIAPGSERDFEVNVGDRVLFAFDKSILDDSARTTLRKQATWLARYPNVTIAVQGNCDERGTREYNIALGARRAEEVKDYLISLGVAPGRLTTLSYGKERPVCVESNEACWSKNRRAVSLISNARPGNVAMRN
jgi:peptidoglycan-associated lipoprotein